jgi:3-deoxy-D-manno-octulosonic-acid transferase
VRVIYNILTYIATFHLKLAAQFNSKLKLGIVGRLHTFKILKSKLKPTDKVFWFHCASLGEYEQGLPIFEILKKEHPNYKIVLSFFSPSGYEIKKNTPIADAVVYLPFDTIANAKRFIDIANPKLVIFVKYEIWPNYLNELNKRNINTFLVSALFRKNQIFFKWYGGFMKKSLISFNHIFTQDIASKKLLNSINITNTTVSGDTRFDRVTNQLKIDNSLDFIEKFKQDNLCVVAGSTWHEDDELFINYINNEAYKKTKFIIAPHNIKPHQINKLKNSIKKEVVLYSEINSHDITKFEVLILDTIGLLSKVYYYADVAYIGGAMGNTGLHNTLEAAVFGKPIIIGKNYTNFPEAKELIKLGGIFTVSNQKEFNSIISSLLNKTKKREEAGHINSQYILKNNGAVIQIANYIRKYL